MIQFRSFDTDVILLHQYNCVSTVSTVLPQCHNPCSNVAICLDDILWFLLPLVKDPVQ